MVTKKFTSPKIASGGFWGPKNDGNELLILYTTENQKNINFKILGEGGGGEEGKSQPLPYMKPQ